MICKFRTNIDCCKQFMNHISPISIHPGVGDLVVVYEADGFELLMKVEGREWRIYRCDGEHQFHLVCWLGLPSYVENIPHLEKILKHQHFSW